MRGRSWREQSAAHEPKKEDIQSYKKEKASKGNRQPEKKKAQFIQNDFSRSRLFFLLSLPPSFLSLSLSVSVSVSVSVFSRGLSSRRGVLSRKKSPNMPLISRHFSHHIHTYRGLTGPPFFLLLETSIEHGHGPAAPCSSAIPRHRHRKQTRTTNHT